MKHNFRFKVRGANIFPYRKPRRLDVLLGRNFFEVEIEASNVHYALAELDLLLHKKYDDADVIDLFKDIILVSVEKVTTQESSML